MDLTSYITLAIMVGTGSWGLLSVVKFVRTLFKDEITLVNRRTGKTITLGKHHKEGQAEKLLDFFE
jgi:hypothetical protein